MIFLPGPAKIAIAFVSTHIICDTLYTLVKADTFAHLLPGGCNRAHVQRIHTAEFNSIKPEFLGQDVHIAFHCKTALGYAKATKSTTGRVVGISRETVHFHMGYIVRTGCVGGGAG